jgi:hypothetical protein
MTKVVIEVPPEELEATLQSLQLLTGVEIVAPLPLPVDEEKAVKEIKERCMSILDSRPEGAMQWSYLSRRIPTSIRKAFPKAVEELEAEGRVAVRETKTATKPAKFIVSTSSEFA